jgi:hypothetical protein
MRIRGTVAWTGGDKPPAGYARNDRAFVEVRHAMFRDVLDVAGPLDFWPGTSGLERARLLWHRVTLDAWRTITEARALRIPFPTLS